jgi:ATP-binding cassette subfamily C (CFTR/MRP) protein 1
LQELSAFDSDPEEGEHDATTSNSDASSSPGSRKVSIEGTSRPSTRKLSSDGVRTPRRKSSTERAEEKPVAAKPEKKKGALIEEEKRAQGSDVWNLVKQYSKVIGLRNVFLMAALLVGLALVQRFADYWLSRWTANPESAAQFGYYLGVYGILAFVGALVSFMNSASSNSFELKAASALHDGMLGGVIRSPMSFFDTTPAGRVLNRFSKDQDTLDTSLPMNFNQMLSFGFMITGSFITIGAVLPTFFVCLAPISWLYLKACQRYRPFSREIKRLISVVRSPIFSCFGEALHGSSTIRAYGAKAFFVCKIEKLSDICNRVDMQNSLSNRWIATRLDSCANLFVAFTALSAVVTRIYQGPGTTAASTGMALTMVISLSGILSWLVRIYAELEGSLNSLERVSEYTELTKEAASNMPDDPEKGWLTQGRIEFKDVVMSYREGLPPVLNGVNFTIEGGKKIGVVGRTGAGKSSLIVAIYRFAELTSGHITIDHRNIHLLGLRSLRSALTIVPQEPVLFSGSVKVDLPSVFWSPISIFLLSSI